MFRCSMHQLPPSGTKFLDLPEVDQLSSRIFDRIDPGERDAPAAKAEPDRVRTRLLDIASLMRGQERDRATPSPDEAEAPETQQAAAEIASARQVLPTMGWLVIIDGPGRGASFPIFRPVTTIGRGGNQDIRLDFGDLFVSRSAHATILLDRARGKIGVRCGGRTNPVLLNGQVLTGTRLLRHKSCIMVGQTTFRFISVEGVDDLVSFWSAESDAAASRAMHRHRGPLHDGAGREVRPHHEIAELVESPGQPLDDASTSAAIRTMMVEQKREVSRKKLPDLEEQDTLPAEAGGTRRSLRHWVREWRAVGSVWRARLSGR